MYFKYCDLGRRNAVKIVLTGLWSCNNPCHGTIFVTMMSDCLNIEHYTEHYCHHSLIEDFRIEETNENQTKVVCDAV